MCLVLSLRGEGQRKKERRGKRERKRHGFLEQGKQLFISRCLFVCCPSTADNSISLLLLLFYLILSIYHPIESPVPDKKNKRWKKNKNENKKNKNKKNKKPVYRYVGNVFSRSRCIHHRFPSTVSRFPFPVSGPLFKKRKGKNLRFSSLAHFSSFLLYLHLYCESLTYLPLRYLLSCSSVDS